MSIGDAYSNPVLSVVNTGFGVEHVRYVSDFDSHFVFAQHLFPRLNDLRGQFSQHLQLAIRIAAECADGRRNLKADHACSGNGDAHPVFHQIGRNLAFDSFWCRAKIFAGNGRSQCHRDRLGASQRGYDFGFQGIEKVRPLFFTLTKRVFVVFERHDCSGETISKRSGNYDFQYSLKQ